MIAHPLTSKHQQQIEGSTSAHASSRSVAARNMMVYNGRINSDVGKVLHYFLLCKSCLWCASYIHHISNKANLNLTDKFRSCPFCLDQSIDLMPLSPCEDYL
ncbi:MAG: hypothetical protein WA395_14940 [Nitrososphaeraceae archaeon]